MNLSDTLRTYCESISLEIDILITHEFGEDFSWDNNVNRLWGESNAPSPPLPSEEYMLLHLWNIREELNGCLHWIDSHSENELKAFIEESHPRKRFSQQP